MRTQQTDRPLKKGWLNNLNIGTRLTIGFGLLVVLTFLSVGLTYLGSGRVTTKIHRIGDVRIPTAFTAFRAQANLLRILASVRGYLAFGDPKYRDDYNEFAQEFERNLTELNELSPSLSTVEQGRLRDLNTIYQNWLLLPEDVFALYENKLEREPAYHLLAKDGTLYAEGVLRDIAAMIDSQGQQDHSAQNMVLLQDIAKFQGNFAAMISALRSYVTTREYAYKQEYEKKLADNQRGWEQLYRHRASLASSQQELFQNIAQQREALLDLTEGMFQILEGEHWREDWYLFTKKAIPYADIMQKLLVEMTETQQSILTSELTGGRQELAKVNRQILAGGFMALMLGVAMSFIFGSSIAGPIRRLTATAEQIQAGALATLASVESGDEIGILADTFNSMTHQLRQMLEQVKREKKLADDLLKVVIPIGVQLSSEKDFHHLLEKILVEAKTFCHADAGTLYLRTEDEQLKFVIIRNDTKNIALGGTSGQDIPFEPFPIEQQDVKRSKLSYIATQAVQDGISINLPNYRQQSEIIDDYQLVSLLTIPLKNSVGEVRGILQLINAQDPETNEIIPFDQNLQQMMESFSLLAVVALEAYVREQSLREEIQQLRVEIDEVHRQKQVRAITGTKSFQGLQTKAAEMRQRRHSKRERTNKQDVQQEQQTSRNMIKNAEFPLDQES